MNVFIDVFVSHDYDLPLPNSSECIVDAGANIGMSTLYFANRCPDAHVIAIEPESSNFRLLEANTKHCPNITAINAGLWHRGSKLRIANPSARKWSFQVEESDDADSAVKCVTPEQVLQMSRRNRLDVLKVDIEGAERELFRRADSWLGRVNMLIIELHDRYAPGTTEIFYNAISRCDFSETRHGHKIVLMNRGMTVE